MRNGDGCYLRHGEGLPCWQTFVERLDSSATVRRSPEDAVAGAHTAAFRWFGAREVSEFVRRGGTAVAAVDLDLACLPVHGIDSRLAFFAKKQIE
jgi:hypothetical protein